jgi:photosystem II stability/assembly factor-like uncharacterized protein
VKPSTGRLCGAFLALAASGLPAAAQRWETQYLYDQDKSSLVMVDFEFASARRGIAVGYIEREYRRDPVSLVTSDGGRNWQRVPLKKMPVSLFFLNEGLGWMVSDKGLLWKTTEGGRNWTAMPKPPAEILRVYFNDERNGWAVGARKSILQTRDGGQHWSAVAATPEPPGDPKYSAYTLIAFATPRDGFIGGLNLPPQSGGTDLPAWADPQAEMNRHRLPHLSYSIDTRDGGKTWRSSSASVFGEASRIRFLPNGQGLALIVYAQDFYYPSEVFKIDWRTGRSAALYKDQKFAVSDVWLDPDGTAYLAGTASEAKLRDVVPGKVRVLMSKDGANWTALPVDYRASAHRAMLASAEGEIWMATDAGMILKLAR